MNYKTMITLHLYQLYMVVETDLTIFKINNLIIKFYSVRLGYLTKQNYASLISGWLNFQILITFKLNFSVNFRYRIKNGL